MMFAYPMHIDICIGHPSEIYIQHANVERYSRFPPRDSARSPRPCRMGDHRKDPGPDRNRKRRVFASDGPGLMLFGLDPDRERNSPESHSLRVDICCALVSGQGRPWSVSTCLLCFQLVERGLPRLSFWRYHLVSWLCAATEEAECHPQTSKSPRFLVDSSAAARLI